MQDLVVSEPSYISQFCTSLSSYVWPTSEEQAVMSEFKLLKRIQRISWIGKLNTAKASGKSCSKKDAPASLLNSSDESQSPIDSNSKIAQLRRIPVDETSYMNTFSMVEPEDKQEKKVLVMAHGFGVGLGLFYRNYQTLADLKGWDVYSIDWLGMGRSSRPRFNLRKRRNQTEEEHIKEAEDFFVDSFEAWRKELKIEKFHLLGHSLGGYLSTVYALKHPERVEKLILASPVGIPESPFLAATPEEKQIIEEQQASMNPPRASEINSRPKIPFWVPYAWNNLHITPQWIVRMAGPYGPKIINGYVTRRFAHLVPEEQKDVQDYIYHIASLKGSGEYALSTILSFGAFARNPLINRLPDVKVPISFVYGEIDWMDHRHAEKVLPKLKLPSQIKVLPGVGHQLFIEKPEQFNQFLMEELSL